MFFFNKMALFLVLLLFIFNPYTVFGNLGLILLPIVLISLLSGFKGLNVEVIFLSFVLIFISMVGVVSSFVHDIGQFSHLKVSISLIIYVFIAHSFYIIFSRGGFEFNDFIHCVLLASSFNSLVIIFEVYFPAFRQAIESFLLLSGNVDWTEGFRYRGIASGGGASLSVLVPVSVVLSLYLYSEKYLNILSLIVHVSILIFSVFFIGRTGLILLPFVALFFVFFNAKKYLARTLVVSFLMGVLIFAFFGNIRQALIDQYGVGFYDYSVGFLMPGGGGIGEEGTVGTVIEFLTVMPKTFPEVLVGYGFYGGSYFHPWTDSGYSRMFLSVGYVFGSLFYISFFLMFRSIFFYKPFLFLTIGALLLIAEAKEPLLFTGYSARIYILILVVGLLSKKRKCQSNPRTNISSSKVVSPLGAS